MTEAQPFTSQHGFSARFDWGEQGLYALAGDVSTIVIVDVLSFSTSVAIAVENGARVFATRWKDNRASALAKEHDAALAGSPDSPWSLRPSSLVTIPNGTHLILPSPNGATLSMFASETDATVLIGCLRNAAAIGAFCRTTAGNVAVIAAGERWGVSRGPLRPAVEDFVGAGAILQAIGDTPSPEATAAIAAFEAARVNLLDFLWESASGRELVERGFPGDVALAAELDSSLVVPRLRADGFIDAETH